MSWQVNLNRREREIVERLIFTGVPKNVARALVHLINGKETTSVEIEKRTGLRQPEVSIAMRELRKMRWVSKRDIKKEGKGRPIHGYRLARPFDKIVAFIEKNEEKKIQEIRKNLNRLKRLVR